MAECPACGTDVPAGAMSCPACGLSATLFAALALALNPPAGGAAPMPPMAGEIHALVGPDLAEEPGGPAALSSAARFPAVGSPVLRRSAPAAPISLPEVPAVGPGEPKLALRQEIDELLSLGRHLGIDLAAFEDRTRAAVRADDLTQYEAIRRELFVHEAAHLAEALEAALARRNELLALVALETPDAELDRARAALAHGDLAGGFRALRSADERLGTLEETWGTVQVLSVEADLLTEAIVELGGDPAPALGPVATARERARAGQPEAAERLLLRGIVGLWLLAAPRLTEGVRRVRDALAPAPPTARDRRAVEAALQLMARELRARNFGAAVLAFRRARELTGRGPPAVPAAPT